MLPLTETQCAHLLHIPSADAEYNDTAFACRQEAIIIHLRLLLLKKRMYATVNGSLRMPTAAWQLAQRFMDIPEKQFPYLVRKGTGAAGNSAWFASLLNRS